MNVTWDGSCSVAAVFLCISVAGADLSREGSFINLYLQFSFFPFVLSFLFLMFLLCRKFRSSECNSLWYFTLRFFSICFTEFVMHRIWANEYCNVYRQYHFVQCGTYNLPNKNMYSFLCGQRTPEKTSQQNFWWDSRAVEGNSTIRIFYLDITPPPPKKKAIKKRYFIWSGIIPCRSGPNLLKDSILCQNQLMSWKI